MDPNPYESPQESQSKTRTHFPYLLAAGLTFALGAGMDTDEALSLAARCGAWCAAGKGPYGNQPSAADL